MLNYLVLANEFITIECNYSVVHGKGRNEKIKEIRIIIIKKRKRTTF